MKAKNIVVGLRIKVKDSSPMAQAKGKFGTVLGERFTTSGETYVQVVIDGVDTFDDYHTLNINSLKYSDEVAVVGDRIVVRDGCGHWYQKGAGGLVERIDGDGDAWVEFDSGQYDTNSQGSSCAGQPHDYAIIREVKK